MFSKLKEQIWQWRGVLVAAPSVAGLVILLRLAGFLQMFELAALDQLFIQRPQESKDDRIVLVEINESDIKYAKDWPMSDALLAKLLQNIKAQKPRAIGLDLYRDLPREPGHKDLVKVFETTPNLIGIQKVVNDVNSSSVDPPPELKKLNQIGANDVILDPDGKIRRGLLYLSDQNKQVIFSLATQLSLLYLKAENINPQNGEKETIKWGKTTFSRFESNDGGYVRAPNGGYQILLNFHGAARGFRIVSMADVIENKVTGLGDRIVLIGPTAESLKDLFYTPYSSSLLKIPERMAGVEIHANLISQILSSALSGRPQIKSWNDQIEWLWILVWSGVGATITWQQRHAGGTGKRKPLYAITIVLSAGIIIGGGYLSFLSGWWIPIVPPLLALSGSALAITAYIAKTAGDIRETFGRYLTDDVVANLLENPEGLKLGGERRKITIFTSDLRGFTAISERLPPEDVVKVLNIYLGYMADVITKYQGTIDEFMGDGILVLFGAPTARPDDAERSIACAIEMQLSMIAVNEEMNKLGLSPLKMGIGINTGEVVVGNIGSAKRTKYGIVGSQVNLTYRIESYTTEGQILISQSTLEEAGDIVQINGEKQVQPKGIKTPITIYDVGGITGKYNLFLQKEEQVFFQLPEEIFVQYAVLDGKDISNVLCKCSLVKLSAKEALVRSENSVKPLTNIKLNLLPSDNQLVISDDIYAKVLEEKAEDGHFYIYFTNLPPEVEKTLGNLYKSLAAKS